MTPKAELHVHLEGAAPPDLVRRLAKRNKIDLPEEIFGSDGAFVWDDFLHFLSVYDAAASVIHTAQDYRDVTFEYLASCAAEGAIYVEVMSSPDHAAANGMSYMDHVLGIAAGIDDARQSHGIESRLIVTCVRHFGTERAVEVARQVVDNPWYRARPQLGYQSRDRGLGGPTRVPRRWADARQCWRRHRPRLALRSRSVQRRAYGRKARCGEVEGVHRRREAWGSQRQRPRFAWTARDGLATSRGRMGARVVEGTGLENRQGLTLLVGSNPTPSAKYIYNNLILLYIILNILRNPRTNPRSGQALRAACVRSPKSISE